jgi:hypothetical protein
VRRRTSDAGIERAQSSVVIALRLMSRAGSADIPRMEQSPPSPPLFLGPRRRRSLAPLVASGVVAAAWLVFSLQPLGSTGLEFAALTLVLAIAGRYAYVKLSPSSDDLALASGWVFVLALAFAVALDPVKSFVIEPDLDSAGTLARSYGLVPPGQEITAVDRCVARRLRADRNTPASARLPVVPAARTAFYRSVCARAQAESVLLLNGIVIDRARLARIEEAEMERPQAPNG